MRRIHVDRAAALLTLLVALPVQARADERPDRLIGLWQDANGGCRGFPGDDPRSIKGCEERTALGRRIGAAGWCYGERGQRAFEMRWHRCGPASIRPE